MKYLILAIVTIFVMSCSVETEKISYETLNDRYFILTNTDITISFQGSNFTGFSGLNYYQGYYTVESDKSFDVTYFQTSHELVAGDAKEMALENTYIEILLDVNTIIIGNSTMKLTDGSNTMLFSEVFK